MTCEMCHCADATVSIRREVDGQSSDLHVCEACAHRLSADSPTADSPMAPLIDLLFSVGLDADRRTVQRGETACATCGMSRSVFRERQRLGCPDCYEALGRDVRSMIKEMQAGDRHVGKIPARRRQGHDLASLERKLNLAVSAQRFEEAAELRDRIRALRETPGLGLDASRRGSEEGA